MPGMMQPEPTGGRTAKRVIIAGILVEVRVGNA
jgi:hypothetical protein